MRTINLNIFSLLIALMFFTSINAQLKLGVRGGYNVASLAPPLATSNNDGIGGFSYSYSDPREGYYGGILGEMKLGKVLNAQLQVNYSEIEYKTYSRAQSVGGGSFRNSYITLNLVDVRGLILYQIPLGSGKASIGGGASLIHTLKGKVKKVGMQFAPPGPILEFEDAELTKLTPGLLGDLKFEFKWGGFLEVSYNYLFKPQPDTKLSVFELGAGFNFQFKRKKR